LPTTQQENGYAVIFFGLTHPLQTSVGLEKSKIGKQWLNWTEKRYGKPLQVTSGFMKAGVYARPNICANLQMCRPPKPL
jgi:hypothetical protein